MPRTVDFYFMSWTQFFMTDCTQVSNVAIIQPSATKIFSNNAFKRLSCQRISTEWNVMFHSETKSFLDMDILGKQKSGFGCFPKLDGLMDIKEIILDFFLNKQ